MAIWYCVSNDGNINDASKFRSSPGSGAYLVYADLVQGDTLHMNGKTNVLINTNIQASNGNAVIIRNQSDGTGAAGGYLTCTAARTIKANFVVGNAALVQANFNTTTLTIIGNITGGDGATVSYGLSTAGSMVVDITGNVTGGTGAATAYGIYCNSTGAVTITGNVLGGSGTNTSHGIYNNSTAAITVSGNVTGGTAGTAYGIYNNSTGNITVQTNVTGGSSAGTSYGIYHNGASGTISVTGNVAGGSTANNSGIVCAAAATGATIAVTGNVTGGGGTNCRGIQHYGTLTVGGYISAGTALGTTGVYNIGSVANVFSDNLINTIAGGSAYFGLISYTPGTGNYIQYPFHTDVGDVYDYGKVTGQEANIKSGTVIGSVTGTLAAGGGGTLVGDSVLVSAGG